MNFANYIVSSMSTFQARDNHHICPRMLLNFWLKLIFAFAGWIHNFKGYKRSLSGCYLGDYHRILMILHDSKNSQNWNNISLSAEIWGRSGAKYLVLWRKFEVCVRRRNEGDNWCHRLSAERECVRGMKRRIGELTDEWIHSEYEATWSTIFLIARLITSARQTDVPEMIEIDHEKIYTLAP